MASMLTPFLIWLLCVGIAALAIGLLIKNMNFVKAKEGFDSSIRITTCPASTATYITAGGDTNCCDGDIVDGRCNGRDICSLSPTNKSGNGMMSCADWITREWRKRSDRFCAPSVPYYFGTMHRKKEDKEGCSASPCSQDGSQPQDITKPTCKIYKTSVDEYGKADSCFNMRARDAMVCPIPKATKEIVYSGIVKGNLLPALLRCTYIPPNGSSMNIPVNCNDVGRFQTYINATLDQGMKGYINMIEKFIDSYSVKDVNFCPASKAFYVDGTLTRKDAFGIPGSGPAGTINAQGGIDPPTCQSSSGGSIPPGADPRCYVDGALVGTPYTQYGNKYMSYTEKECKQLGGVYDGIYCSLTTGGDPRRGDSYDSICGKLSGNSKLRPHPKCLVNGVKLGTKEYQTVTYTSSECSQLGGIYDPKGDQGRGSCKPSINSSHEYNVLCFEGKF